MVTTVSRALARRGWVGGHDASMVASGTSSARAPTPQPPLLLLLLLLLAPRISAGAGPPVAAAGGGGGGGPYGKVTTSGRSSNIAFHQGITREAKFKAVGHRGITLWMTGLSGSGKATISILLEKALVQGQPRPYFVYRLDADMLRKGLNSDLGFSAADRAENVRRIAETALLFAESGAIVVATLVSPNQADREYARALHGNASLPFLEVFVDAPLEVVQQRDPKGLYAARATGQVTGLPGIDTPYEKPGAPDLHLRTYEFTAVECVNAILRKLDDVGLHLPRKFRHLEEEPEQDSSSACDKAPH